MEFEYFFNQLWNDYINFTPHAKTIYDLVLAHEQKADPEITELVNDHIAIRTYDVGAINLESLARIFIHHDFEKCGEYVFEDKKLRAWHFEHPHYYTKVFVSELETRKFSPLVQETAQMVAQAAPRPNEAILWSGRTWEASHETYKKLLTESEYAAWVYAFGFRPNHFTISVNHLRSFLGLKDLNGFVKRSGFLFNEAGGEIKGTKKDFLEQSATLAGKSAVQFKEGLVEIPACYYEFAKRYQMLNGNLYQGFVTSSADKIFESTNNR